MTQERLSGPRILFVVVTSHATQQRALRAFSSWCAAAAAIGSWCRFAADAPMLEKRPGLQWTVVHSSPPSGGCCRSGHGFFCSSHRRQTLPAQYRFLPALAQARRSALFSSGRAQWVVLLDDDSFVFVRRLRRLLARYNYQQPWMLGEFRADRAYACGGAGAVLSRAALASLALESCIARMRHRCMQSDWQLGECVRRARPSVRLEARHGCGSCAVPVRNCSSGRTRVDMAATEASNAPKCAPGGPPPGACQFMQDAGPHAQYLLQTANCSRLRAPSIVHGGVGDESKHGGSIAAELARRPGHVCAPAKSQGGLHVVSGPAGYQ